MGFVLLTVQDEQSMSVFNMTYRRTFVTIHLKQNVTDSRYRWERSQLLEVTSYFK